ncbi:hypothetical protein CONLIGDRAFT_368077 [Coniochaeta ligniaria NRRL 30616]|uniref:Uncharacterized protein n=1 Tax=Coniochaeta ligniaria NRRL 30616 TaxID=1408157 RepID=A0A1J7I3E6_9PEZI|nr:hypothetical protein CONLIGDRAFT_368077 [Coniochaeta ligniaria NRRL 30616]
MSQPDDHQDPLHSEDRQTVARLPFLIRYNGPNLPGQGIACLRTCPRAPIKSPVRLLLNYHTLGNRPSSSGQYRSDMAILTQAVSQPGRHSHGLVSAPRLHSSAKHTHRASSDPGSTTFPRRSRRKLSENTAYDGTESDHGCHTDGFSAVHVASPSHPALRTTFHSMAFRTADADMKE